MTFANFQSQNSLVAPFQGSTTFSSISLRGRLRRTPLRSFAILPGSLVLLLKPLGANPPPGVYSPLFCHCIQVLSSCYNGMLLMGGDLILTALFLPALVIPRLLFSSHNVPASLAPPLAYFTFTYRLNCRQASSTQTTRDKWKTNTINTLVLLTGSSDASPRHVSQTVPRHRLCVLYTLQRR